MKAQELRKLIREEVKRTLNEAEDYSYMKPFKGDIQKMVSALTMLNAKIEEKGPLSEDIQDAIDSLNELFTKIK